MAQPPVPPERDLIRVPCPLCGEARTSFERTVVGYTLERCRGCGLVYNNPRLTDDALSLVYREKDDPEMYIRLYERMHTPAVVGVYDDALDRIERIVPERGRLLDFGCGAGHFFERAQRRGWDAHGIDMGKWCGMAAERRGLSNLHVGRLEDLGFDDGSFDVVFGKGVLEHLTRPVEQVRAFRRLLRPGGVLYVIVPNYSCLSILAGRDDFVLNTPPQHVNYFTPRTMRSLLARGGFERIRTGSFGGLKWENILGRPYRGDIVESYESVAWSGEGAQDGGAGKETAGAPIGSRNGGFAGSVKHVARPIVKKVLYDWAKVAVTLSAICRRPGD